MYEKIISYLKGSGGHKLEDMGAKLMKLENYPRRPFDYFKKFEAMNYAPQGDVAAKDYIRSITTGGGGFPAGSSLKSTPDAHNPLTTLGGSSLQDYPYAGKALQSKYGPARDMTPRIHMGEVG